MKSTVAVMEWFVGALLGAAVSVIVAEAVIIRTVQAYRRVRAVIRGKEAA